MQVTPCQRPSMAEATIMETLRNHAILYHSLLSFIYLRMSRHHD